MPTTGTVALYATFPNDNEALWPGEFVTVDLVVGVRNNAVTAPVGSVMSGHKGDYVYTISADNVVHRVPVLVVARQNGLAVFTKGVSPGDQVVVNGQYNLDNGMKVAIEPPKADRELRPMNISETFIRRPIATALMTAGLFVFGAVCFRLLPVAALPNVEFPTIVVSAQLPGASPTVMASTVATPLEDQFSGIPGLASMTSTSGLGATSITLQFDLSVNIAAAAGFVEQAIQAASALLPKNLPNPPTYKEANPANAPILIYAVHSDAYPIQELDQYANILIGQSLSRVSGVGQVSIAGQAAARRAGEAQSRRARRERTGLRADQRRADVRERSPSDGQSRRPPRGISARRQPAADQRRPVPQGDRGLQQRRASSSSGTSQPWSTGRKTPAPAPGLGPTSPRFCWSSRRPAPTRSNVVDNIKAVMPQLEKSIPRTVHVDLVSDRSLSIRASVSDVEFTLVLALALVVMVIFLFLRKFWATVIPSITLPVVIAETFAAMYLLGYSIDNLSLMALTIAIGFLVDDAIVMIENIVRHIEVGKPPLEAALDGAGEIGFTILSITLSLAAVFIPVVFMSGVVGLLFHEFAMVTILAIFLSGFVSLTLTPMMCAQFLTRESGKSRAASAAGSSAVSTACATGTTEG